MTDRGAEHPTPEWEPTRRLLLAGIAAATAVAGLGVGQAAAAVERTRMSIFVEGLVTVRPSTRSAMDKFVGGFMEVELPLLGRSGIEIAGGWLRTGGVANQMFNLYRFDSLTAMQAAGRAQATDPQAAALGALYDWVDHPGFKYRRTVRTLTPFSSADRLKTVVAERPAKPRQYIEWRRRIQFERQKTAHELLQTDVAEREAEGPFRMVMAYETLFGEYGECTVIGMLDEGVSPLDYVARSADTSVAERLSRIVDEEEVHFLEPLPYSPVK